LCTLDNFVGHADERKAPQWMRWRKSSICFTHKTASIARLLKKMASWKVNTDQVSNFYPLTSSQTEQSASQPGLALKMIVWARSVEVRHCAFYVRNDTNSLIYQGRRVS